MSHDEKNKQAENFVELDLDGSSEVKQKEAEKDNLEKSNVEIQALQDKLARLAADFDNHKRNVEKDRLHWYSSAKSEVIDKLLPFLDEINLAAKALCKCNDEATSGIKLISNNYLKSLNSLGVREVEYKSFDPEIHEALTSIPVEGKESGEIVEVIKKGFILDKKVLRPAQVIVTQ